MIELMIIVAIIGILAAIAIPQVANLICRAKNKERAKKGLPLLSCGQVEQPTRAGCIGKPISIAVDRYGTKSILFDNGCIETK